MVAKGILMSLMAAPPIKLRVDGHRGKKHNTELLIFVIDTTLTKQIQGFITVWLCFSQMKFH